MNKFRDYLDSFAMTRVGRYFGMRTAREIRGDRAKDTVRMLQARIGLMRTVVERHMDGYTYRGEDAQGERL